MPISTEWIKRARQIVGEPYLYTEVADMEKYAHDELAMDTFTTMPEAVARPGSEEEVASMVELCSEMDVPIAARGGGTGLAAGCVPPPGGIVLALERLNRAIDADEMNHTITVQAGMPLHDLYEHVEAMNLFFPPHPGDEGAFIGGAVAANAGGTRAVKYGTVRRFVLGLQVVLADGRTVELGGKFVKSSSGYNLLNLMIGSEGTLGIITRVTLALLPAPGFNITLVAPFSSVGDAVDAVPSILKRGIIPSAMEFVEHSVLRCAERLLGRSWPAQAGEASLMIILDGRTKEEGMDQAEKIAEIVEAGGGLEVLVAERRDRQAEILEMRSILYEVLKPATVDVLDICVPRSEIAGHVHFIHELEERLDIPLPTFGHAADGNVHTHLLRCALEDGAVGNEIPGWKAKLDQARTELFRDASRRGGVISGEHGIGLAKRDYLSETLGEVNVDLMKKIKTALDPKGILNPGKIVVV